MDYREKFLVEPGRKVRLEKIDPSYTGKHDSHETAAPVIQKHLARLSKLQYLLYADADQSLLVVLQALDAAGKDGVVRHVFTAMNPQGTSVFGFKQPSKEEAAHDFLWRAHQRTPAQGEVVVFNRSHYEDVLVVRVHSIVPKKVWSKRYEQINAFERTLADEGTTIVKFFLYIDRDEQRARFQSRLDDPSKRWKFRLGDLDERKRWDDYIAAYEEALSKCSTDQAPWYVIPSNRKWFRNLAVAEILADTLDDLKPRYPEPDEDLAGVVVE
jgi:PPK2 family polyphosphate:nucleotide phosphotransferase